MSVANIEFFFKKIQTASKLNRENKGTGSNHPI